MSTPSIVVAGLAAVTALAVAAPVGAHGSGPRPGAPSPTAPGGPVATPTFTLPPQIAAIAGGVPPHSFEIVAPIAGALRTVAIERVSFRTEDFRAFATNASGALVEIDPPTPRTLRGTIDGLPEARVSGALTADGLTLIVTGVEGGTLAIEPVGGLGSGGAFGAHAVVVPDPSQIPEGFCATADGEGPFGAAAGGGGAGGGGGGNCQRTVQIAFDADFEFYQSNGSSVPNTIADIENVFAAVAGLYLDQLDVPFLVGTIIVRSNSNDPYTTSSPGDLLEQVATEWSTNQASVVRDLAHLFTGKNLSGSVLGIAFNPGACAGAGYGLTQSKWSGNFNNRVTVTTHELGHNLDADHCNGDPSCGIMCANVGACAEDILTFGAFSAGQITGFADSADCLGPPQPSLVNATNGSLCNGVQVTFAAAPAAVAHSMWRGPFSGGPDDAVLLAANVASPYLDATAVPGFTYRYWVSATDPDGCESRLTGGVFGFTPTLMNPTTFVIATDSSSCATTTVAWAAVSGAMGYQVWRAIGDDVAEAQFLADDNTSPYLDGSGTPGQVYRYWVRTKNACGAPGPFGTSDTGSRGAVPAPGVPSATDGSSCAQVTVTWPAVAGATEYSLWRGTTADPEAAALLAAGVASPYADASVTPGTTYWYFVQATGACGAGGLGSGDSGSAGLAGDLTGDCLVNGADLGSLLSQWGTDGSADLNGDGIVDGADLGLLTAAWTG